MIDPNKIFQISIKGLVFDAEGRVLVLKEHDGRWDLPGGRLEHGERWQDALRRECKEEMGVNCEIIDEHPYFFWSAQDVDNNWRLLLCFRITLDSLDFIENKENVDHGFFAKKDLDKIDLCIQTTPLRELI